jgi:hypothetical protein
MRALGNSGDNSDNSSIGSNTTINSNEEADEFGMDGAVSLTAFLLFTSGCG